MKFGAVPIDSALNHILGHNIAGPSGRRVLRKGRMLRAADIEKLRGIGRKSVYVAQLEAGDVDENCSAARIANAAAGENLRLSNAATGRVNISAEKLGLLRVDYEKLFAINRLDGVTLAALPAHTAVQRGKMVATVKIIPYALPELTVGLAEDFGRFLYLTPFTKKSVKLILSGFPTARERIVRSFDNALRPRIAALGGEIQQVAFVPLEDESDEIKLAQLIEQQASSCDLLLLAGETAIMDRFDIAPRAVERAGGRIESLGAPVDPGNLLMLAYHGNTPILGAPGCSRSPKDNIIDLVLPRLLAGDHLTREDIIAFAIGGLLEDVPERPLPRSRLS
ncbi:MAG: molybdopterin-binding protein [Candidatus Promineifilaceae bacterium]